MQPAPPLRPRLQLPRLPAQLQLPSNSQASLATTGLRAGFFSS
jgi:hypothetical protein